MVLALELLESVAEVVMVESVAVESVAVEPDAEDVMLPVDDATEELSVDVLWAPTTPKLGEKLMLVGSVSSTISMVYWKELTWLGSTVKVAVPSEAGTLAVDGSVLAHLIEGGFYLHTRVMPESGVMLLPDC